MLEQFPIHATAAAVDLERAKTWYAAKLGLSPEREDPGGVWYRFAGLPATPTSSRAPAISCGGPRSGAGWRPSPAQPWSRSGYGSCSRSADA